MPWTPTPAQTRRMLAAMQAEERTDAAVDRAIAARRRYASFAIAALLSFAAWGWFLWHYPAVARVVFVAIVVAVVGIWIYGRRAR